MKENLLFLLGILAVAALVGALSHSSLSPTVRTALSTVIVAVIIAPFVSMISNIGQVEIPEISVGEGNYDGYIDNMIESSYYKEISDFINNQNIKFCKDAKLIFNVCELGKFGGLKKRIEEYYKNRGVNLNVKTYPTKVTPFGTPMIDSKIRR